MEMEILVLYRSVSTVLPCCPAAVLAQCYQPCYRLLAFAIHCSFFGPLNHSECVTQKIGCPQESSIYKMQFNILKLIKKINTNSISEITRPFGDVLGPKSNLPFHSILISQGENPPPPGFIMHGTVNPNTAAPLPTSPGHMHSQLPPYPQPQRKQWTLGVFTVACPPSVTQRQQSHGQISSHRINKGARMQLSARVLSVQSPVPGERGGRWGQIQTESQSRVCLSPVQNSASFLRHAKKENCVSCGGGAVEIISTYPVLQTA